MDAQYAGFQGFSGAEYAGFWRMEVCPRCAKRCSRSLKQLNQRPISLLLLSPPVYFALLIRAHRALDPLNLLTNLDISVKPHLQSSVCICIVPNPLSPTNTNMAILLGLAIYAYA